MTRMKSHLLCVEITQNLLYISFLCSLLNELSRLRVQVCAPVQQDETAQDVHESMQDVLREVQLRAFWDCWQRRRMPLLRNHDHPRWQTQMPLNCFSISLFMLYTNLLPNIYKLFVRNDVRVCVLRK